jgi:hypothetical protein
MADEREIYLMPKVAEAAFAELQALMISEEEFPRGFGEWAALWDDRRKEEESNGYNVRFVDIVPEAFAKFCSTRKIPCSWTTLGQFITAKAGR